MFGLPAGYTFPTTGTATIPAGPVEPQVPQEKVFDIGPPETDEACDGCSWADCGDWRLLATMCINGLNPIGSVRNKTHYCEEHALAWLREKGFDA